MNFIILLHANRKSGRILNIIPTFYKLPFKLHTRVDHLNWCDVQLIIPFSQQQDHINCKETESLKLSLYREWSNPKVDKHSDNVQKCKYALNSEDFYISGAHDLRKFLRFCIEFEWNGFENTATIKMPH